MTFRVRKLDANGDMTFGHGHADFYIDEPKAVGQVAGCRLRLWRGDWYLDTNEGTPYREHILGKSRANIRNLIIRNRILTTPFVVSMKDFSATENPVNRALTVTIGDVITAFGIIDLVIPASPPPVFTLGQSGLDGTTGLG